MKVQHTRLELDMNGTHQVLAYADDVNLIEKNRPIGKPTNKWENNIRIDIKKWVF